MRTDNKREIDQFSGDHDAVMGDEEESPEAITGQTGDGIVALRARTEDHLR